MVTNSFFSKLLGYENLKDHGLQHKVLFIGKDTKLKILCSHDGKNIFRYY